MTAVLSHRWEGKCCPLHELRDPLEAISLTHGLQIVAVGLQASPNLQIKQCNLSWPHTQPVWNRIAGHKSFYWNYCHGCQNAGNCLSVPASPSQHVGPEASECYTGCLQEHDKPQQRMRLSVHPTSNAIQLHEQSSCSWQLQVVSPRSTLPANQALLLIARSMLTTCRVRI